jgi:hypothetical protein
MEILFRLIKKFFKGVPQFIGFVRLPYCGGKRILGKILGKIFATVTTADNNG